MRTNMVIECAIITLLTGLSIVRGQTMMTEKIPLGKSALKKMREKKHITIQRKKEKLK